MPTTENIGPLNGVRVLDLTRFPPGQYCTLLLADLGADVLRVDPPAAAGRRSTGGEGVGLSRGKRSITVDIRGPEGVEVLRKLAAASDVLVENSLPGQMESRGFGYPQAEAECPSLIWCSVTGFGQDGPYATRSGHDLTYTAHAGLLTALHEELPWHPEAMLSVPLGGMMAATGVISALYERTRSGKGCQVDVSLADASTWLLSGHAIELTGVHQPVPLSPRRRLYKAGDGRYISVAADEPRTWANLCTALELPDLVEQVSPTKDEEAVITERLAAIFATAPARDWVERLGPLGTAVGMVNRGSDVVTDPHNVARGTTVEVGGVPVPANPIRLRETTGRRSGTATAEPAVIGADTDATLASLGYSPEDVDRLREAKVV
jgi:crotonobetainyl-CoA:carnitine CoA-transferase CaiB-like acyl-CoA transferase